MKREPLPQAIASWKMKLKSAQNELNKKHLALEVMKKEFALSKDP